MEIVAREWFSGGSGSFSGATFERCLLADGRTVVLKHLPPEGDWLTRVADGFGRARLLWESGVLDRVADTTDHAVIDMFREDDHDVIVMDDVTDALVQTGARVPRHHVDRLLAGMAALHGHWEGCDVDGLCTPAHRNRLFSPVFHSTDDGPHSHQWREAIVSSWETFADVVPDDVVQAVFAVHRDATALEAEMRAVTPWTLLHGDTKLENLGVRGERLVAIDWGELTGTGPAAMDLTWFVMMSTAPRPDRAPNGRIDAMPGELFAAYETHAQQPLDARALGLACIGMFAQMGCSLSFTVASARDEPAGARASQLLDWWVARVRQELENWSPT